MVVLIYVALVLLAVVVVDAALCIDVNKAFGQHYHLQCIDFGSYSKKRMVFQDESRVDVSSRMINQLEEWTHIIEHLL